MTRAEYKQMFEQERARRQLAEAKFDKVILFLDLLIEETATIKYLQNAVYELQLELKEK